MGSFRPKLHDRSPTSRRQSTEALNSQRERSPSPTFADSQDWWTQDAGCVAAQPRKPRRSICENSEGWPWPTSECKSLVSNRENLSPSRFKKTVSEQESSIKRRLRLDTTQSEEQQRLQRRHAFPTMHRQLQKMRQEPFEASSIFRDGCSPRGGNSSQECSSMRGNHVPNHVVDAQHRTSAEMAATIMPELSSDSGAFHSSSLASLPLLPKYFVGNDIVDWQNHGRRMTRSPSGDSLQVGGVFCSPRASHARNVHEPQSPSGCQCARRGGAAVSSGLSRAKSVQSFEGQVCFGEMSSPPSSLLKDKAFLHSGLSVVKFGSRSPGRFSPNAHRVTLTPAMSS